MSDSPAVSAIVNVRNWCIYCNTLKPCQVDLEDGYINVRSGHCGCGKGPKKEFPAKPPSEGR